MKTTNPEVDITSINALFQKLIEEGFDGLQPVFEWLINACMKMERSEYLKAAPYERSKDRTGYANGYKPKTIKTRLGEIQAQIPQVRGLDFYPKALEKGSRSEVSMKLAVAEMYVQGVSTRRVKKITEQLCGLQITSSEVSRVSQELDEKLSLFRERDLGEFPVILLDARYEKVRHSGSVRDCSTLIAVGITREGCREVLGVSVSLSEAEVHWRTFLESMVTRGLHGVRYIVSDDHSGLKAARRAVFPASLWQRCQFHMAQNAQHYAPKKSLRELIARLMREIFNARNIDEARQRVKEIAVDYQKTLPEFVRWLEENIEEGLTVFNLPEPLRKRLRTSNLMETTNKQVKRRTRVAALFPNTDSCLRLSTAVLQEIHEDWACGRKYLDLSDWLDQSN